MATNKTDKVLNVPTLRFPGFTDEWQKKRVGDIAKLSKGAGISKDDRSISGVPCILYGELYTTYNSEIINEVVSKTELPLDNLVQSEGNDVIIPSSGESAIDISTARCITTSGILLGGDLNIIRLKNDDGRFLSYQLNGVRKIDIAKVAQGVSVVHLYGDALKSISVSLPHIDEQKKIADFLSLLDERIALQSKLIDRLKSLMDGIRHRLFEESTVHQSLGNIVEIRKGKQINGSELLDYGEYPVMNGGITPSGFLNEYNIPAGTISISEGGNSCGYVQFNATPIWSGGHCYTLHLICGDIDYRYLYHFLKHSESEIMKLRIGSGLPNIQKKDLSKFPIISYPISNQMKISKTLDVMEARILNEEFMLQSYAKLKAYLLSVMFI